eukprot:jgi/Psemu1/264124/estExt_Genewise1Plus.C_14320001
MALALLTAPSSTVGLPQQVFWDNKWPSDLEPTNQNDALLKGTVLFAQAQTIPSKHGIENDDQPHLTALRKTLVMLKPHGIDDPSVGMEFTVRDKDGAIVSGDKPVPMNDPENMPKHDGWLDLGAPEYVPEFPSALENPYEVTVTGQNNLDMVGNDHTGAGLNEILNDNSKTPTNEVEVKTFDGSWVKEIYLPDGSGVPTGSKIQITCNSGWDVRVYYPNVERGDWRSRLMSRGDVHIFVLTPYNNAWILPDDLQHNDYVFGHNFYSATMNPEWVKPGMTLEFASSNGFKGSLEAKVGGVTELIITTLNAGFLTEPRNEFTFRDDPTTNREYLETTLATRLTVVQYETIHLTEIMLPTGKFYDTVSDTEGGGHTGDMREHIGKILLSHGIDLANYGISSSLAQSESPHPFTCAFLAAHNTVGLYQNGVVIHGWSGGNGMITLYESTWNEMSHEVGHNYELGHDVGGFDGSVHRPANEINSAWGWDSTKNVFVPNFSSSATGKEQCLDDRCQSAFMDKYQYGRDAMSGGEPLWGLNRYTQYTPHVMKKIQKFLESRAMWDASSSTGFVKFDASSGEMKEFVNNANGNKAPRLHRVPVTTIVGYYEPDSGRGLESYVYPALHGALGFVYDDDSANTGASNDGCKLVVETNKAGNLVYTLETFVDQKGMNKFHVNVATADEPYKASVYCQKALLAQRALDGPQKDRPALTYTVNGYTEHKEEQVPTMAPTMAPTIVPNKDCDDSSILAFKNKKKKNCKWVGRGKKVAKKCKKKWNGTRIFDWCPKTCAKVGLGKCTDTNTKE